ncbi:MAG: bifunctional metallophosphatase/5'-nucleotidase [Paracoccaceae bacterium]|nr:bifunctional metallophosphatase/5'-nucleotidase [Paracoccaceae bacterium]
MLTRLLLAAASTALMATAAAAEYKITILHTNDFHDRFEPISRFNSTCRPDDNAEGKCFGGMARMVTAVNEAKARHDNVMLLDAGDQFQGTLFFQFYGGDVQAEMMNVLGYDAMAVGNHEFNNGPEGLLNFVSQVEFPVLMSNADLTGEPELRDVLQRSVVIEKAGERIGIIGVTPLNNDELSSPGPNIVFTDPSQAIQAEIDALEADGVDKIILLSHSGYQTDLVIAIQTLGLDLIIGGHSNTLLGDMEGAAGPYPTITNGVPIVTAFAYGKYLGELELTFDDAGNVTEISGQPILIDASVAEDEGVLARLAELAEPLDEVRNEVVAEASAPIEGDRSFCRAEECEMGNLVADAMLDRVKDQGIQIALANGGGLRASIDGGEITKGEVLTVLPFQNTLSTFEVTGATLKDALENAVLQYDDPDATGRFAQVAGLKYTITPSNAFGSRISDVMVMEGDSFVPLDPEKVYGVVSNNFIRNGGDGYSMFVDAMNAYDFGPDLADVTAEFLAENSPYTPYLDGRITIVE